MQVALYAEINILCMIMLSVMAYTAARFELDSTAQTRTFVAAIWSAFTMNLCEVFWGLGLSRTIPMPAWALHVVNALYFTMLCCTTFFWFVFSEYMFRQSMPHKHATHLLLVLPLFALIALLLINPFTGCLFTFGGDMKQIRGPLYYMQHVLGVSYLLLSVALYLARRFSHRNIKYYLKQNEDTVFISFAVPLFLCIVLQIFFQELPVISVSPVIAFMLAYASVIKLRITLDPLTGINNRRSLLKALAVKCRNVKKDCSLYFLFIDIDHFKNLNDVYGHYEGDRALQSVANTLSRVCRSTGGFCARYGGDEFAVMQELAADKSPAELCRKIETAVSHHSEKAGLACTVKVSVGYAEFNKDAATAQELIDFADGQMYRKKAKNRKKAF